MRRLQIEAFRWSSETFGSDIVCGPEAPLAHLRKEIDEVLEDPKAIEEWADVLLLVLDGISRAGYSVDAVEHAAWTKLDINRKRKWGPPNAEGFSEHTAEGRRNIDPDLGTSELGCENL